MWAQLHLWAGTAAGAGEGPFGPSGAWSRLALHPFRRAGPGGRVASGEHGRNWTPEAFCLSRAAVHPSRPCFPIGQSPARDKREEGRVGGDRVTSAQDGGPGGAGPSLAERALARRAGLVREAGDAAPPGLGPGERPGRWWAPGAKAPSWISGRVAAPRFWDAAPQGAEWNAARVSACPSLPGVTDTCSPGVGWVLGAPGHALDSTSFGHHVGAGGGGSPVPQLNGRSGNNLRGRDSGRWNRCLALGVFSPR